MKKELISVAAVTAGITPTTNQSGNITDNQFTDNQSAGTANQSNNIINNQSTDNQNQERADTLPNRDPDALYTLDLQKYDTLQKMYKYGANVLNKVEKFDSGQITKFKLDLDKLNHPEHYDISHADQATFDNQKPAEPEKKRKKISLGDAWNSVKKKVVDNAEKYAPAVLGHAAHIPPVATREILRNRPINILKETSKKGVEQGNIQLTESDVKAMLDSLMTSTIQNQSVFQNDVIIQHVDGITFVTDNRYVPDPSYKGSDERLKNKPAGIITEIQNTSVNKDGTINLAGVEDPHPAPLKKGEKPQPAKLLMPKPYSRSNEIDKSTDGQAAKTANDNAFDLIKQFNEKVRSKSHANVPNADEQNVAQLNLKQWETLITQTGTDYKFIAGKESKDASGIADWNIVDKSGVSVGSAKRVIAEGETKIEVASNARWGLGEAIDAAIEKAPVIKRISDEDKALLTNNSVFKSPADLKKQGGILDAITEERRVKALQTNSRS